MFGITIPEGQMKDFLEIFKLIRDDETLTAVSKEPIEVELDGKKINLRFVIRGESACNTDLTITEDGKEVEADVLMLSIVPEVKELPAEFIQNVAKFNGWDLMDENTLESFYRDMDEAMLDEYGYQCCFVGSHRFKAYSCTSKEKQDTFRASPNGYEIFWPKKILDEMATTSEMIRSLIGFYLDKPMNQIGWTGWAILKSLVNGTYPDVK